MRMRITTLSLGLLFTAAYAAPLLSPQLRLTPSEVDSMPAHDSGAGTSGVAGIRTTVMSGDPTQDGPYTIRLSVPANTKIQAILNDSQKQKFAEDQQRQQERMQQHGGGAPAGGPPSQ